MNNLKSRVTIYEVAKVSGVSLATVSRVINKQTNVTAETKKKVEDTIKKLGYKPSSLAQGLATSKSTRIGIVIPSANYVYIANMLNGMTDKAKSLGYDLTLFITKHSREDALSAVERVITSHVDGAIIFDDELDLEEVKTISSYQVPVVVINNNITGDKVANITFGYEHNVRSIIRKYLKSDQAKKMYFLHVHNAGKLLARIEKAFVETHIEENVSYGILSCDDSYTRTYEEFLEFFKTNKSGYFLAYRDSLASAIINAAIDSGLNVPNDVEVLSLIGTKYAHIMRPQISSMHIDLTEIGRKAIEMLKEIFDDKLEKPSIRIESKFIARQTTR